MSASLLIDGGAGSGVPGIPALLALATDKGASLWSLLLVESQSKKQDFLESVLRILGMGEAAVYRGRIEDPHLVPYCEERFPGVGTWRFCSKALANLDKTLDWLEPMRGRLSGIHLLKGPRSASEILAAPDVFQQRGWAFRSQCRADFSTRKSVLLEFEPSHA